MAIESAMAMHYVGEENLADVRQKCTQILSIQKTKKTSPAKA